MTRTGVVRGSLLLVVALALSAAPLAAANGQEAPARLEPTGSQEAAPASALGATGLSEKEEAVLQKINALKAPRWRLFGACRYDWSGWKLLSSGVRTTAVQCGPETADNMSAVMPASSVALHCDTLKLSVRTGEQPWSSWRLPYSTSESKERGGEDLMVASLCANAKPIPKPQPAPPPVVTPAAKPAAKSSATPASKKPTATSPQKPSATKP